MFDKKEEYNIRLPDPIHCNADTDFGDCYGMLVPIFVRENNLSDKMVIIWKCSKCRKEIK